MANIREVAKNAPHAPGVYIFRTGKTPVYVGKAVDIRKRLSSYFRKNVSAKTRQLLAEATSLEWIETPSEIDALIQEAETIKAHVPRFNVLMRDDKNYFYVAITREAFPRIFLTHQPYTGIARGRRPEARKGKTISPVSSFRSPASRFIGPFTSGAALKEVLALVRRTFPYCTCTQLHRRPCLNSQIGRCQGFCCRKNNLELTTYDSKKEYGANIKNIISILTGKKKKLLTQLKRDMRDAANKQDFEQAARLRNRMTSVENIFEHRYLTRQKPVRQRQVLDWQKIERVIKALLNAASPISRVEGYDISNISGAEATGSMVVFVDGKPDKSEYRKFRIKTVGRPNDVAMHAEVMRRRLARHDWPRPDLLVIDGGKPQLNAILSVIRSRNSEFRSPVVALAKREEELFMEGKKIPQRLDSLPTHVKFFFQHVRDESHRFAKKYHHKLREMRYRRFKMEETDI